MISVQQHNRGSLFFYYHFKAVADRGRGEGRLQLKKSYKRRAIIHILCANIIIILKSCRDYNEGEESCFLISKTDQIRARREERRGEEKVDTSKRCKMLNSKCKMWWYVSVCVAEAVIKWRQMRQVKSSHEIQKENE